MVNYIHHIENTLVKFKDDQRITPWHISLYMSLFQIWNSVRFKDEINIRREELMEMSKIGSANTYSKCLKQLSDWNYINYIPSKSRFVSSKVHMYRFDTSSDTTPDTSCDTSCDTSPDTTSDTSSVHLVRPFINNIKHIVNYNKQYKTIEGSEKKSLPPPPKKIDNEFSFFKNEESKNESHLPDDSENSIKKTTSSKKTKRFVPPELKDVIVFFKEKKSSSQQAEMFFNHFESNGWMVGGRAKMKDWKAAARNWITRSYEFKKEKNPSMTRLNVNESKDYNIPL